MNKKIICAIMATFLFTDITRLTLRSKPRSTRSAGLVRLVHRCGSGSGGENIRFGKRFALSVTSKARTLTIEYRYAEDKLDRLPALAEEWSISRLTMIVTGGQRWNAALAAKKCDHDDSDHIV